MPTWNSNIRVRKDVLLVFECCALISLINASKCHARWVKVGCEKEIYNRVQITLLVGTTTVLSRAESVWAT
jgi:hypothetical protein